MGCGTGKINRITSSVLVIGATGNIGKATVYQLHKLNINVIAGVRDIHKTEAQEFIRNKIKVTQVDMSSDESVLVEKMKGFEAVFLVTPGDINRSNITVNAAKAAQKAKVKYVLSVSAPVAGHSNIFGKQFNQIEEDIKKIVGISYGFLRLPMFTDNNFGNISTIKSHGVIYGPIAGNLQFSTVAVKDAAQAAAQILSDYSSYKNKTLHITSDKKSYDELAQDFSTVLNKKVSYVQAGYEGAKQAMIGMGMPAWQVDGVLELYKLVEKKDISQTGFTNTFEEIVGSKPTTNINWIRNYSSYFVDDQKKQEIIVLGASGNIGSATVKSLHAKNAKVTAGVRDTSKAKELPNLGVSVVNADMGQNKSDLTKTLSKYNIVYIVTPGHIDRSKLAINAIQAARDAKVEFILVLSVAVADNTNTIFGKQFNEIEKELKQSGVNYGIIRLPMFTDNLYGNASAIVSHNAFYGPVNSDVKFATVTVEDAANSAAEILTNYEKHSKQTYTIISDLLSSEEQAKSYSKALGRQINYVNATFEGTKKALLAFMPEWQVDGVLELYKLAEKNDRSQTSLNNDYQCITGNIGTSHENWMKKNYKAFSQSS